MGIFRLYFYKIFYLIGEYGLVNLREVCFVIEIGF